MSLFRLAFVTACFASSAASGAPGRIVTGTGPEAGGLLKSFAAATLADAGSSFPYSPSYAGGVRVAVGDVNGDGTADIVTGTGAGAVAHVKVFDGRTGAELHTFLPFGTFTGGVHVAAGDVNGDGRADIVVGADAGGGPHVTVFAGADLEVLHSFFAYANAFTGGVRVAAGDVNGDGIADIVTGSGPGGVAHVKVFHGTTLAELHAFLPYAQFTGGVHVAAGDVNGDGRADIVTGAGEGAAPHVKVFDGRDLASLQSFFAYTVAFTGGVRVAAADLTGDGRAELVTASGAGSMGHIRIWNGLTATSSGEFFAFGSGNAGGAWVAAAPLVRARLTIRRERERETVELRWPAHAPGVIETSPSLETAQGWEPVNGGPQVVDDSYQLVLPMDGPRRFFRLRPND